MNTALVVRLIGGWTLTSDDGTVVIDSVRSCVQESCRRTFEVEVDPDGLWRFDSGVEIRWVSPTSAVVRADGGGWLSAKLTSLTGGPSPWDGTPGERLTPSWDRGGPPGAERSRVRRGR